MEVRISALQFLEDVVLDCGDGEEVEEEKEVAWASICRTKMFKCGSNSKACSVNWN